MVTLTQEQWEAAEFVAEWSHDGSRYKLFSVPREVIDEGDDEPDAHLLLEIVQATNVRSNEWMLDAAYGRLDGRENLAQCDWIKSAPEDAREIIEGYYA